MPQLQRHSIAVTCGAGGGIGCPASSQDHPPGVVGLHLGSHAGYPAVFRQNMTDPPGFHGDILAAQLRLQAFQNRGCPVCYRKYPVSPLGFQRAAPLFKKRLGFFRRKGSHGAVEEPPIPRGVLQHLLAGAVVGHVAAALSGDQQLSSQPVVAFQQQHPLALACRGDGGKHSGRTAADHNSIKVPHRSACFS